MKGCVLLMVMAICAHADEEPVETISSLVTDSMWDCLLERVDRYILPVMPFWYEELEPVFMEPAVTAHHMGEHNVIKSFLNVRLREWREKDPDNPMASESILAIMKNLDKVHENYRSDIRFFGGGFVNHCFYFGIMSTPEEEDDKVIAREPQGYLLKEIKDNFGSFEELRNEMEVGMRALRGSGYIWMVRVPGKEGKGALKVITTSNQDSPVMEGLQPLVCIDMWEHAYYLKHNYKKWDHLKDFWMVIDWSYVERLDKWWNNQDEEQKKADERIATFVKNTRKREQMKKDKAEKEKKEKTSKAEL